MNQTFILNLKVELDVPPEEKDRNHCIHGFSGDFLEEDLLKECKANSERKVFMSCFSPEAQGEVRILRGRLIESSLKSTVRPGYIYLLNSDMGTKIGSTKNLEKRIQQLQTGLPFESNLAAFHKTEKDRYKMESRLHQYFFTQRTRGEWFTLTGADVARAIELLQEWETSDELH